MKARITGIDLQLHVAVDDGEYLTPAEVPALRISPKDWPEFAEHGLDRVLTDIQAQIDQKEGSEDGK